MVARHLLLLIGPIVLLVDDDQSKIVQRREKRRARPDDHIHQPLADAPPLTVALPRCQCTVQHRHTARETRPTVGDGLRGERDLWHQQQRSLAPFQRVGDGLQVHLGLA